MDIRPNDIDSARKLSSSENFERWKANTVTLLKIKGLYSLVNGDYPRPSYNATFGTQRDFEDQDVIAKYMLSATLATHIYDEVLNLDTAKDVWDYLIENYSPKKSTPILVSAEYLENLEINREDIEGFCKRYLQTKEEVLAAGISTDKLVDYIFLARIGRLGMKRGLRVLNECHDEYFRAFVDPTRAKKPTVEEMAATLIGKANSQAADHCG